MNRTDILQEINDNSPDDQKEALKRLLSICTRLSQFTAFTVCHWRSTGKLSYQAVRVWTFSNAAMREIMSRS